MKRQLSIAGLCAIACFAGIACGQSTCSSIICRHAIGATKTRGGDMGFFSEFRMPPDFFAAVVKMHVAEISKPIRTRLGFHIIQLTDRKQARRMTFDEARGEIGLTLENEKRQTALQNLVADLLSPAEFVRSRL
jgi:parvulin-like peptidyl-prolyl isomerase